MARDTLTGSRIRERRGISGLKQADLARAVGISASYLNLIEHNRRRIGGKLLLDIAQTLEVDPSLLTEGAEAALLAVLREAAADVPASNAEVSQVEEFASRFPGWAELIATSHRRVEGLQETVQTLSDRLTHDPHLAESLHELLTTAAAIRSTASILVEPGDIDPAWRDRFHKNINADARRLAESSKALVGYLDESGSNGPAPTLPQEEAENFVASHGHHFSDLETGAATPAQIIARSDTLQSAPAKRIAEMILTQMAEDARVLPKAAFLAGVDECGVDPIALSRRFAVDLPIVFRRVAAMPAGSLPVAAGLVICDASGSIVFRKDIEGFAMPRFGASCPLWPVFTALTRPLVPLRRRVSQLGRTEAQFDCMAVAWPEVSRGFDEDPVYRSAMLILPVRDEDHATSAQPVGAACRLCPRDHCPARREPSILGDGF